MPKVSRVGIDTAGGLIVGNGQSILQVNGTPVTVVGDPIANHGPSPHNAALMVQGSSVLRVNGIPICLAGHLASCGHTASGSGPLEVSS